jgi:hypothetical protein
MDEIAQSIKSIDVDFKSSFSNEGRNESIIDLSPDYK